MTYFSAVQTAADQLNAACVGEHVNKKVTNAELLKNTEKEMRQLDRYKDEDGTSKLLKKLFDDNATFKKLWLAVVMKEKSDHFLDKALKAWSLAGGAIYSVGEGEAASRTTERLCKFYLKGNCTYGKKCKFKHEGSPPAVDAVSTPGKNGVNRFGKAIRCYTQDCHSKDHRVENCPHPNKMDSKRREKRSRIPEGGAKKKAKFNGDASKVYTVKCVDGEWVRQEAAVQTAVVATATEIESDNEQKVSKKQKQKQKAKTGTKGVWFAALNVLALCALGIAQPQSVALSMAPLFADDTVPMPVVMYHSTADNSLQPNVFAAQSSRSKHAITVGTNYLALNEGGCQLGGIWNSKKYFYTLKTGNEYRPAKMGNGSLCKILGYGTIKLRVQTTDGIHYTSQPSF
jgi:hypothetical protein